MIHSAVRGKLTPFVHWGTSTSSTTTNEPPQRLMKAATGRIAFVIPRPGEVVDVRNPAPVARW
jgi:hypothetical protein